jgi:hypothetical protein
LPWLQRHQTGPLLRDALWREGQLDLAPKALVTHLTHSHKASIFLNLRHAALLRKVAEVFDREAIPWVVLKGHHVGPIVYPSPACRPSVDIDVLVSREERDRAIHLLLETGFKLHPSLMSVSHEVRLTADYGKIDLHWDLCRPGRTAQTFTRQLLGTRVWSFGRWVPSDDLTLVYLAIHTAFTEHVTGRWIRLLDIDRWIRRRQVSWQNFESGVTAAHAEVAAWSTLHWCQHMLHTPIPHDVLYRLQPKRLRRSYLDAWLASDPCRRYRQHPIAVRILFSLMLEDNLRSMISTVFSWARCRLLARRDVQKLMHLGV